MKHCKYFFFVYAIVILSSVGANAATVTGLATPDYVKGAMTKALADAKTYADTAANNAKSAAITSANANTTTEIGKLATVARTGSYNDLSNKPTLGKLAAKDTIAESDITGSISQAKISGLSAALGAKQITGNMVNPNADGNIPTADVGSTTKYPSIKAAEQIAAAAAADKVSGVTSKVNTLENDFTDLAQTVENNKTAAEDAIKGLTGTQTGSGVVKSVTQANGKVTSTRGLVTTAEITDLNVTTGKLAADAVTNAKLADNAVQTENIKAGAVTAAKTSGVIGSIPSGSATATTYAQIWVQ